METVLSRKEYPCNMCDKSYTQKGRLTNHRKVAHENHPHVTFTCQHCPKQFKTASNMRRHVNNVLLNIRHFQCDICDQTFPTKVSLEGHKIAKHGGRKVACAVCSAEFSFRHNLVEHERRCHDKSQKGFTCDACSKVFSSKRALTHHTHTDATLICEICGRNNKYPFTLRRHRLQKHNKKWSGKHFCWKCFTMSLLWCKWCFFYEL